MPLVALIMLLQLSLVSRTSTTMGPRMDQLSAVQRRVQNSSAAYAVVVSNQSSFGFFSGCIVAAVASKRVSKLPIILVVEGTLSEHRRAVPMKHFDRIHHVLVFADMHVGVNNLNESNTRFQGDFAKLYLWTLTQYDSVVVVDADTLILKNVDELHAIPGFVASRDRDYNLGGLDSSDLFNSGVLKLRPNKKMFNKMVHMWKSSKIYLGAGEQSLLNKFFHRRWTGVRNVYNVLACCLAINHPDNDKYLRRHTRIVHFTRTTKPWEINLSNIDANTVRGHQLYFHWVSISFSSIAA